MATTTTVTLANDFGKWMDAQLIERSELMHRLPQAFSDGEVDLPQGVGKTATFQQYTRIAGPMKPLDEGVSPSDTDMAVTTQSVVPDQYGLFVTHTDLGLITTKHPVVEETIALLADAISRTVDWTIMDVLDAGASKQYWDGSRANRGAITATDVFNKSVFAKALVSLRDQGAPPKDGDFYMAIHGPQVEMDIVAESGAGAFTGVTALRANAGSVDNVEKGLAGAYLGHKLFRSNFLPKYQRSSAAIASTVAATTGGSLTVSTTYYYKIVRRSTTRGFSELMDIERTQATGGADTRINFTMPATAGYVYDIYFGTATGDANLRLHTQAALPSSVTSVDSVPAAGSRTAPATPAASVTVHPIIVVAKKAGNWVGMKRNNVSGGITPPGPSDSDPLGQRRKIGSKYFAKAGIRDATRFLVIELASNY